MAGRPVVHLYSVCWNEAHMLPFFFRHYEPWVDRFVIYDNGSTDGSVGLLSAKPNVELRTFPWTDPNSFVQSHCTLHNQCWRESRGLADWVVVAAVDEHLYHPDMPAYLGECSRKGFTCVPALGYQMVTKEFPSAGVHLASAHTFGAPAREMNKLRLFKPDLVEPNFAIGGHSARPTGRVVYPNRDEVLLLHYKYLGIEYVSERNLLLKTGLRLGDRENDWGRHYRINRAKIEQVFENLWRRAVDVRGPGYVAWQHHQEPRFWRVRQAEPMGGLPVWLDPRWVWKRIKKRFSQ